MDPPAHLPVDIFLEIFSKLPIKSLIRCKSVSKLWHSLISHPLLPNLHLTRSSSSSSSQSLILYSKSNYRLQNTSLYFLDFNPSSSSSSSSYHSPIKLNLPSQVWLYSFTMIGSCNGLLCLLEVLSHSQEMYIYNPSTSHYFRIPDFDHTPYKRNIGFGFDLRSGKYKVVRIVTSTNFLRIQVFRLIIDVYTIGDSGWRSCGNRNQDGLYFIDSHSSPCVYVNGVVHWKGYKVGEGNKYSGCVVCFDLGSEEVGLLPFPDMLKDLKTVSVSLMVLGGCLCVLQLTFCRDPGFQIMIWVMKDYGVKESWVKEFVITESPVFVSGLENAKVLCFDENGEIVLICGGRQLVAYDPVRENYRDMGFRNPLDLVMAVPHSGSIIPAAV